MLNLLLDFVDANPQRGADGGLNYVPFGGSAVRALEERYKKARGQYFRSPPRVISDVDVLALGDNSYPVHSSSLNDIFCTGIKMSEPELRENLVGVSVKGREIVVPNPELIIATKSVRTPRQKDYDDVALLHSMGIDESKLARVYEKCGIIAKNGPLVVSLLERTLSKLSKTPREGQRFLANLTQYVNLIDSLPKEQRAQAGEVIEGYVGEDKDKDGYESSTVLNNVHNVWRHVPARHKIEVMRNLFLAAKKEDHTEFDNYIHFKVVPSLEFAEENQREGVLRKLGLLKS